MHASRPHPHVTARATSLLPGAACLLAAVLAAGLAAGCADEPPPLVTDRVHDLVAMLARAEIAEGSHYLRLRQAPIELDDTRDGIAYLRTPVGQPLTFPQLEVSGPAVLRFGCGTARPEADPAADAPVRFRVQVAPSDRPEGHPPAFLTVFDEFLDPATLAPGGPGPSFALELPGSGTRRLDLRLSAWTVDGAREGELDWPVWFSPQVRSEGRTVPAAEASVPVRDVVFDALERLAEAEIVEQSEDDPVRRSMFDPAAGLGMGGGLRQVLRVAGSTRVRYGLVPTAGSQLEWAAGIASWEGWKRGGDGMTFAVELDGERVWERRLDAANVRKDRGWHLGRLDLSPRADRSVTLDLVTEAGPDATHDVGGWSETAVVRRRAVPALLAHQAPSVVLVVVDTLRADRLGAFGGPEGRTPHLDALASRGRTFLAARSASSWTWPATSSILTGLYPNAHGVQDEQHCVLVDSIDTLGELFARAGYATGAFAANPLIAAENNFDQGFATFACTPTVTARSLNRRVEAWLENTQGRARFAYIHYMDPHHPYRPPPAFAPPAEEVDELLELSKVLRDQLRGEAGMQAVDPVLVERWVEYSLDAYDAEIAYFDTAFGELLDLLGRHGVLDDALLVFTSDHGEEFLEHGLVTHGPHLYDETVRVPLVITGFGPSALSPGRVTTAVETRDILPTLAAHLGLPAPSYAINGGNLLEPRPGTVFSQTMHGAEPGVAGFTEKQSMATDQWKLIRTPASGRVELYDLVADPRELVDLAPERPRIRDAMLEELDRWARATSARRPDNLVRENPEATARLQALGYLGR